MGTENDQLRHPRLLKLRTVKCMKIRCIDMYSALVGRAAGIILNIIVLLMYLNIKQNKII